MKIGNIREAIEWKSSKLRHQDALGDIRQDNKEVRTLENMFDALIENVVRRKDLRYSQMNDKGYLDTIDVEEGILDKTIIETMKEYIVSELSLEELMKFKEKG